MCAFAPLLSEPLFRALDGAGADPEDVPQQGKGVKWIVCFRVWFLLEGRQPSVARDLVLGSRFPVDFVHRLRGKGGTRIESLIPIVIFWPFALVPILPARSSADASERGPMEGAATALIFKECLRRSELRKLQ